jgi:hypothetical protein
MAALFLGISNLGVHQIIKIESIKCFLNHFIKRSMEAGVGVVVERKFASIFGDKLLIEA